MSVYELVKYLQNYLLVAKLVHQSNFIGHHDFFLFIIELDKLERTRQLI